MWKPRRGSKDFCCSPINAYGFDFFNCFDYRARRPRFVNLTGEIRKITFKIDVDLFVRPKGYFIEYRCEKNLYVEFELKKKINNKKSRCPETKNSYR